MQGASQRNEQGRTPDAEGRFRDEAEAKKKKAKAPEVKKGPPEEYDLTIRHAVEEGEVQLRVWSNWTFGAVRKALAKKLGRDDIQKKARFVFRAGDDTSAWLAFKDCRFCNLFANLQCHFAGQRDGEQKCRWQQKRRDHVARPECC